MQKDGRSASLSGGGCDSGVGGGDDVGIDGGDGDSDLVSMTVVVYRERKPT